MNTKLLFAFKSSFLKFVAILVLFVFALSISAQNISDAENNGQDKLLQPAEEKFEEADALVAPWRISGCHNYYRIKIPDCYKVSFIERNNSRIVSLYNEDGSLWYRYSNSAADPNFYGGRDIRNVMNLLPFATYPSNFSDTIFRMVGESPHWYKVEVNEETRATKFVLKSDPLWAKRSWDYWLTVINGFEFDDNQPALRDKPNGQIIEESANIHFPLVLYTKRDGDWAFVEGYKDSKIYEGWIKWREGRELLYMPDNYLFFINKVKKK